MKEFKNLVIFGDTLSIICVDTDTNEETVAFEVELKPFYFNSNQDLEHNVFSTDSSWLFDVEDDENEEIKEGTPINLEFMENFCCDVPDEVATMLEDNGITVNVVGYEDEEDEHERKCYYIDDFFEAAIKKALNIDDTWHKKAL